MGTWPPENEKGEAALRPAMDGSHRCCPLEILVELAGARWESGEVLLRPAERPAMDGRAGLRTMDGSLPLSNANLVELAGIEPATSCMPCKRSPS